MIVFLDSTFLFTAGLSPNGAAASFLKKPPAKLKLVTGKASLVNTLRNLEARDWSFVRNLHRSIFHLEVLPSMGGNEVDAAQAASASLLLSFDPSRHEKSAVRALSLAELKVELSYET
jgi:hypothetical protein